MWEWKGGVRSRRVEGRHVRFAVRCYYSEYRLDKGEELLPQSEEGDSLFVCLIGKSVMVVHGNKEWK